MAAEIVTASRATFARSAPVPPAVTVAISVKDRRDLMARCLDGLLDQEVEGGFCVVVVDNGSTDGTLELLRQRAATATIPVIVLEDAGTLGRARNVGLAAAAAPIVAFTDSDCVPAPGWLAALVAPFADPEGARLAIVQGQTLAEADAERGRWSSTQELTAFTDRYEACNIAYRRDALRDVGGFDEDMGFFGEDTAAGWAIRRAGWKATFAPAAVVHHAVTHPGLGWHLRRAFGYGNWNALVKRFPEMRTELLWHRWFLRRRSATFTSAVIGLLFATRHRRALVLVLPYVWLRRPKGRHRADLVDALGSVAFDGAIFCGLVRGSIRERTVVL